MLSFMSAATWSVTYSAMLLDLIGGTGARLSGPGGPESGPALLQSGPTGRPDGVLPSHEIVTISLQLSRINMITSI